MTSLKTSRYCTCHQAAICHRNHLPGYVEIIGFSLVHVALTVSLAGVTESNSTYCDRYYCSMVCPSVCTPWSNKKQDAKLLSITSTNNDRFSKFFHCYGVCPSFMHCAEAVGRNEMSFGTATCTFPSNIVLDRGPRGPSLSTGRDLGLEPQSKFALPTLCNFPFPQITVMPVASG